jgi:hypothetical protein
MNAAFALALNPRRQAEFPRFADIDDRRNGSGGVLTTVPSREKTTVSNTQESPSLQPLRAIPRSS